MADRSLRQAERGACQASQAARARLLVERVRVGRLHRRRLEALADAGVGPALVASGRPPLLPPSQEPEDVLQLRRALVETIVWCSERLADGDRRLRTPALFPEHATWRGFPDAHADRVATVQALAERRAALLRADGWAEDALALRLAGGRLLLYDPDATLSDGAAELVTGGFFDAGNVPAWDTWLAFVEDPAGLRFSSSLLCWVPSQLVGMVADGVEVNPEECIAWASDVDAPLSRALMRAGITPAR